MAKSKQERDLDAALAELYPFDSVVSEFAIVVDRRTLFVDRVLPSRMIAIEVDGRQHFEYSSFFHGTPDKFQASLKRDKRKAEWLIDHGYSIIRFKYDEIITTALLRERVLRALTNDGI